MSYSPNSATLGQGSGAVTVNGQFDFIDSDGNVSLLRITDSDGGDATASISGVSGVTASFILFSINADTSIAGTFTFQIWIIDTKGNASNKLNGTFTVS